MINVTRSNHCMPGALIFSRDVSMCMRFGWLSGWSPQVAYHTENKHSWLQSTLSESLIDRQALTQLNLSLQKVSFLKHVFPQTSCKLLLQQLLQPEYLAQVLSWAFNIWVIQSEAKTWRGCFNPRNYCFSAIFWSTLPLFKPINLSELSSFVIHYFPPSK